ncbi:DUF1000-domain-containing protein [Sodiomyces alkalinus F11]|uniref:DUF1000-domain-containing protein n=1 Tax=Sodiomyces alkalinus (strain CBS 110278 / VKM F-3762 / F11) TaxID=1314773 RepID=A0A3N2PRW2_SODAK|nr:DUF1000-domain-containing protein [Sodiomyces alkalinus F11]ROT37228.1 DUF1000-domain-containing protein [Sodiomyces alkalinus F11]
MSASITQIESKAQFDSLIKETAIVVCDFYADWCGPCKAIAPFFQKLSETAAGVPSVRFIKVDTEANRDIAATYSVTALPTFIVFQNGKVLERIQGADPRKLQQVVVRLAGHLLSGNSDGASASGSGSGSGNGNAGGANGSWRGAELPRGYTDITSQIEPKGYELLNADDNSGPVKVLFDGAKPSALGEKKNEDAKDKDWVESGQDDQLLLFMPFQSMVKLHTLQLTSLPPKDDDDDAPMRPGKIHLYTNKPHNLDFSEADDTPPTQAIELTEKDWNADGTANIGLRFVKFQNITSLIIYVVSGEGEGDKVRLDRVRLVGDSGEKREMGKLEKIGDEPGE